MQEKAKELNPRGQRHWGFVHSKGEGKEETGQWPLTAQQGTVEPDTGGSNLERARGQT